MELLLFEPGQEVKGPTARLTAAEPAIRIAAPQPVPAPCGEEFLRTFMINAGRGNLLEMIPAFHASGGLAGGLDGRQ